MNCWCCGMPGDVRPVEMKTTANGVAVKVDTLPLCKLCRDVEMMPWLPYRPGEKMPRTSVPLPPLRSLFGSELREERAAQMEDRADAARKYGDDA